MTATNTTINLLFQEAISRAGAIEGDPLAGQSSMSRCQDMAISAGGKPDPHQGQAP